MTRKKDTPIYIEALRNRWFYAYRSDIKIFKLENYLKKSSDRTALAKAINYSMMWSGPNRHNEAWVIFYQIYRGDSTNLAVYSLKPEIKSIHDLIVIDYSILVNEDTATAFKEDNKEFIDELKFNLKLIWNRNR